MLRPWQVAALAALAAILWAIVTYGLRAHPAADPWSAKGLISFWTAPIGGLVSVWLCKFVGRLSADQLLPGVSVVGAIAMLMDGAALQYFPHLYGSDLQATFFGAGGLLWGYGMGFAMALVWVWIATARRGREYEA